MSDPLIPGGFIVIARKVTESEIWDKPPLYMKVWLYLLARAQHADYKALKRGELRTSIPEIIEACKWHVGARVERPTKDQVYQILQWLRNPDEGGHESNTKATMITTTKATQGLLVNVDNYGFYQDIKNYESNAESNREKPTKGTRKQRQHDNINKNVKNDKNNKKDQDTISRQSKTYAEDSLYFKMASYLHQLIMNYAESLSLGHLVRGANIQSWADDCRKIIELDKRDKDEVRKVMMWSSNHSFWQKQILSPSNLRKKYERLCFDMAADSNKKPQEGGTHEKDYRKGGQAGATQSTESITGSQTGWIRTKRNADIQVQAMQG